MGLVVVVAVLYSVYTLVRWKIIPPEAWIFYFVHNFLLEEALSWHLSHSSLLFQKMLST